MENAPKHSDRPFGYRRKILTVLTPEGETKCVPQSFTRHERKILEYASLRRENNPDDPSFTPAVLLEELRVTSHTEAIILNRALRRLVEWNLVAARWEVLDPQTGRGIYQYEATDFRDTAS